MEGQLCAVLRYKYISNLFQGPSDVKNLNLRVNQSESDVLHASRLGAQQVDTRLVVDAFLSLRRRAGVVATRWGVLRMAGPTIVVGRAVRVAVVVTPIATNHLVK